MDRDFRLLSFLRKNGAALLAALGLFFLFYFTASRLMFENSDYAPHARWALAMPKQEILASFYNGSEHLWHVCVRLAFDYLCRDIYKVAAAVTALADAAAYLIVYRTFEQELTPKMPRWLLAVILLTAFVSTALALPGGTLYWNAGGLSTWHNPTNIMVRPFAAAVFYMTVRIYNRRRFGEHRVLSPLSGERKDFTFEGGFWRQFRTPVYTRAELVLYPLCLVLSVYAKPSFLQFFAPAIFLFLLFDVIRTKGMLLPFCLKLALAYIPAAIILFTVFRSFFPSGVSVEASAAATVSSAAADGGSGIALYFLRPAFAGPVDALSSILSECLYVLRPCAFAVLLLILGAKNSSFRSVNKLAAIMLIVAVLESWLLHETGSRAEHGNLLWGSYLASWLMWTAAAGEYAELVAERSPRSRAALYVGTPLLVWHLVCGIAYLAAIFRAGDYLV